MSEMYPNRDNVIETALGKVVLSEEMLSNLAGQAAVECYGLVGMSAVRLRDGLAELLKKENLSRGVKIKFEDNQLVVELYVIVSYGTRIPEVAANVMEKVKYIMEKITGIPVLLVNLHIQGVQPAER